MTSRIQRKGSPIAFFLTFLMITSPTVCLSAEDMWSSVFEYQHKMASYGNPEAQVKLGEMYEEGHGTQQDYDKARLWYKKAADQGFAPAKNKLSKLEARQRKAAEARQRAEQERIAQEELERVRAEREKSESAARARRSQAEQRRQARAESRAKNRTGKRQEPALSAAEKAKQEAEGRRRAQEAIEKMLSVPSAYNEE